MASTAGAMALLAVAAFAPGAVLDSYYAAQRWAAGVEQQARSVGEHRWSWLESGSGPPLVLVHGFTGAKENWLALMPLLSQHFRVIAPDLPGWGGSSRVAGADYGYAAQAERLTAFLGALQLHDAVLVGHSMGGGIAAMLAAGQPQALRGLVLMDAGGVRFEDNAFGRAVLAGDNPFAVSDRDGLRRYLAAVFVDPPWVPWPLDRAMVQRRRADRGFEDRVLEAIGRSEEAFAPQRAAPHIAVPTLLLWCREDRIIDASAARIYRSLIGDAVRDTVLLEGCNHMPMMERPEAVATALHQFARIL